MIFRNFDPLKYIASFNGVIMLGFGPDTMINVERNSDAFETIVGAGGDVTRVKSHDRTGVASFTLLAESPANDLMMAAYQADQLLGLGRGALLIQNLNGTTFVTAPECWIMKIPPISVTKSGDEAREWQVACADLSIFAGGALT